MLRHTVKQTRNVKAIKKLIVVYLLIITLSGLVIKLNLDSVYGVSTKTGNLINTHVAELKEISDLQALNSQLMINLHQYYANLDQQYYKKNQNLINSFKILILNNPNLFKDNIEKKLLQSIIDFDEQSISFHKEMSSKQRDWEKLRQYLYESQDYSNKSSLLLNTAIKKIRETIEHNSIGTLSELKFLNNFQLIFIFALLSLLFYTIYALYARTKDREKLFDLAYFDKNTKLPNKIKFKHDANTFFNTEGDNNSTLFLINIDRFRLLTGRFGHDISEELILNLSTWIEHVLESLGHDCIIYKYATTTWIVYLPNSSDNKVAINISEQLLGITSQEINIDDIELTCSFSIGVSFNYNNKTHNDLVREADSALYHSVEKGGNCFHLYSENMGEEIQQFVDIDNALRHALDNKELKLYYQPKIDAQTGKVSSSEVLLRWFDADKFIPPNVFIPIAEKSGFITQVGNWVLREACKQWMAWQKQNLSPLPIAINISAIQFQDPEFPALVSKVLQETGMPASMLELEITEEAAIIKPEKIINIMLKLKDIGVSLAIDDFGTGYSSLAYLRRFPLDILKIDQTFVRSMLTSNQDNSIVKLILDLAKRLNFRVVAEGVEYVEQYEQLREWGTEYMQGYHFYKPMPEKEFCKLLQQNNAKPNESTSIETLTQSQI